MSSNSAYTSADDRAQTAVRGVTSFVNGASDRPHKFTDAMAREHRTLQQGFTGLCVAWLEHLAELEPGQYDGRNEASVELAKKLCEGTDHWDRLLPLI